MYMLVARRPRVVAVGEARVAGRGAATIVVIHEIVAELTAVVAEPVRKTAER